MNASIQTIMPLYKTIIHDNICTYNLLGKRKGDILKLCFLFKAQ